MSFPDRPRAVVTGAASGFGRAISLSLASRGGRLLLSDVEEPGLRETVEAAERAGAEAIGVPCDVRDPEQVSALAAQADERWGGADILVNNAGVAVAGKVGEVSLEDWKWQIDINLWGVIHGCHSFVPGMRERGQGWILNVASAAGLLNLPMMAPYNVTKAGVVSLSETLCAELSGTGVRVTALCPTFFRTRIHESARCADDELAQETERLVTQSRWSAERVAEVALRGLERGDLYVIPQADGNVMWRAKRLLGAGFYEVLGRFTSNPRLRAWLSGAQAG